MSRSRSGTLVRHDRGEAAGIRLRRRERGRLHRARERRSRLAARRRRGTATRSSSRRWTCSSSAGRPETVLGFDSWPYGAKPVFVLSGAALAPAPAGAVVERLSGEPADIVSGLAARGFRHAYVDGGITIQRFLRAGLIQRLIVTRVPVLIGTGIPLFGDVPHDIQLRHIDTRQYASGLVQSEYALEAVDERCPRGLRLAALALLLSPVLAAAGRRPIRRGWECTGVPLSVRAPRGRTLPALGKGRRPGPGAHPGRGHPRGAGLLRAQRLRTGGHRLVRRPADRGQSSPRGGARSVSPAEQRARGRLGAGRGELDRSLTHVTVIDGTGAAPRADQTVILDGARIADLFPAGAKPLPRCGDAGPERPLPSRPHRPHVHLATDPSDGDRRAAVEQRLRNALRRRDVGAGHGR